MRVHSQIAILVEKFPLLSRGKKRRRNRRAPPPLPPSLLPPLSPRCRKSVSHGLGRFQSPGAHPSEPPAKLLLSLFHPPARLLASIFFLCFPLAAPTSSSRRLRRPQPLPSTSPQIFFPAATTDASCCHTHMDTPPPVDPFSSSSSCSFSPGE